MGMGSICTAGVLRRYIISDDRGMRDDETVGRGYGV